MLLIKFGELINYFEYIFFILIIFRIYILWWLFLRQEKLIAKNAISILSIKLPNIRKVKKAKLPKVEDVTIENNLVTVDKPNPSSEKKLKPQRKSLSDYNVMSVKEEDVLSSEEPKVSFSWISNKLENKEQVKGMLFINDQPHI